MRYLLLLIALVLVPATGWGGSAVFQSGGGGHAIQDEDDPPLSQQPGLKYTGAGVSCENVGALTVCTITSGGGSGTMTTLKENNVAVGGADIVTADFLGADFDLAESPDTEIQIVIAAAIARDAEITADIATHSALGNDHHTVYADADVLDAINGQCGDAEALLGDVGHTCVDLAATYQPADAELTTLAGLSEAEGSIIIGSGVPAWSALAIGASTAVLLSDGSTAAWDTTPAIDCTDCTNVPGGSVDTITEGDSSVEVVDAGTGKVVITVDAEDLEIDVGAANQIDISSTTGVDTIDIDATLVVTGLETDPSADPGMTFADSTHGSGGRFYVESVDAADAKSIIGVDDSSGSNTPYIEADGSAETVDLFKPLFMLERAAAAADVATYGQLWVKNEAPNELWFTDDDGTPVQLGAGGGAHTIASHSDTTATGAELETLTDASDADALHNHTVGNLSDTGVTETEMDELETIGDTSIEAADWTAVAAMSGVNSGDEVAADLTTAGVIEIATAAETNTGTDATRAVSPDGLEDWTGSAQLDTVAADIAIPTTGIVAGAILIHEETDAAYTIGTDAAGEEYGGIFINSDDDVITFTLPAAAAGMNVIVANGLDSTAVITIDLDGSDQFIIDGNDEAGGDAMESAGAAGEQVSLVAIDAQYWMVVGMVGTWGVP